MKALLAALLFLPFFCLGADAQSKRPAAPAEVRLLAAEGVKISLPGGGWFTWRFAAKPKLGSVIVKVQAFNPDGSRNTAYEITGETGMPEMRAHDSGRVKFVKNKKGDYLLPFDVVMPGEWHVLIRVKQGKKEIYAGKTLFTI
jgi:hypothetical protein